MERNRARRGACGKIMYDSKTQARSAMFRSGARVTAYHCNRCHAWHVSLPEKR